MLISSTVHCAERLGIPVHLMFTFPFVIHILCTLAPKKLNYILPKTP
jgi:7,8-dihydro-6-hydroxymethylpterin-pyrophosphokinase